MLASKWFRITVVAFILCQSLLACTQTQNVPHPDLLTIDPEGPDGIKISGPGLKLRGSIDEPFKVRVGSLNSEHALEIQLVNTGKTSITVITAQVIFPLLKDMTGKPVEISTGEFPPLEIKPLETVELILKLNFYSGDDVEKIIPDYGIYDGSLFLTIQDQDNTYTLCYQPLYFQVSILDSTLPTVLDQWVMDIQFLWQNFTGENVRFGPAEWSFLAVAVALFLAGLFWLAQKIHYALWVTRGKLGPIIVDDVASHPELRSELCHYLFHCGIEARTAVPNTSIGAGDFTTVITQSKIPEAAFVGAILAFLRNLFNKKPGYVVTMEVSDDGGKTSINVQIRLTQNNQVKFIETLDGDTAEEAIKKVAYYIYYRISCQKVVLARIPKWSRFPTFGSFLKYKHAEELKGNGDYEKAIEEYRNASLEAPFNALLRQGWGDAYELNEQYLDALEVYLEVVSMWPYLYSFWYRIAVNFSYTDSTWFTGEKLKDSKIVAKMFQKCFGAQIRDQRKGKEKAWKIWNNIFHRGENCEDLLYTKGILAEWKNNKNCYKKATGAICNFLNRRLTVANMLAIWLWACLKNMWCFIFYPTNVESGLPRYYWRYIPFLGGYGTQIKRMGNLIGACSVPEDCLLNKKDCLHLRKTIRRVRKIVNQPWNGYLIYYDAACFYARLYALKQEHSAISILEPFEQGENIRNEAMRLLKIAERQPSVQLFLEWARIDPDLKSLHDDKEFKALLDISTSNAPHVKQQEGLKARALTLTVLRKAAVKEKENWIGYDSADCLPGVLVMCASQQVRLWTALNALAADPTSENLREAFWIALPGIEITLPPSLPFLKEQGKLETCLSFIKRFSDAQVKAWSARLEESKLYLANPDTSVEGVWAGWCKAECDNWETLEQKIKQVGWKPRKPYKKMQSVHQETAQIEGE